MLIKCTLSRQEQIAIISSVLEGIACDPHFNEEIIKARIQACLNIAEEVLYDNYTPKPTTFRD